MFYRVPTTEDGLEDDESSLARKLSKRGASLRLKCIGKQESDENPLMSRAIARNAIPAHPIPLATEDNQKSISPST